MEKNKIDSNMEKNKIDSNMEKNKIDISVLVPVFNEEESIRLAIQKIRDVMNGTLHRYEIIAIDDGSDDKSLQILDEMKDIQVITHPSNQGYGASLKTGIKNARGDWILITDADGTYPAEDIPKLLEHIDEYDMVVGARTGKTVKIQAYRRPAKWFLSMLANYLSWVKIPDLNSGLRIFRRGTAMEFSNLLPDGFSFTTTVTLAHISNNYSVKYVPIDYHERVGDSKIRPLRDGPNFILLIIRTIMYFNPLKIFLPIGFLFFLLGVFVSLYSVLFMDRFMDVTTVILMVAGIQVILFGMLADLIIRRNE